MIHKTDNKSNRIYTSKIEQFGRSPNASSAISLKKKKKKRTRKIYLHSYYFGAIYHTPKVMNFAPI